MQSGSSVVASLSSSSSSASSSLLERMLQSLVQSDDLGVARLLEEVRALDRRQCDELAAELLGRAEQQSLNAAGRRAFARFVDAFVEVLGPQCCTAGATRVLLSAVREARGHEELLVAAEVLASVLMDNAVAWHAFWDAAAERRVAADASLTAVLLQLVERAPELAAASLMRQISSSALNKEPEKRAAALELLGAVGAREEVELSGNVWGNVLRASLEVARDDTHARNVVLALGVALVLLKHCSVRRAEEMLGLLLACLERGFCWADRGASSIRTACAALFFHVYAVFPWQVVVWAREKASGQNSMRFRTTLQRVFGERSVPLHPGIFFWEDDRSALEVDSVQQCWMTLWGQSALGASLHHHGGTGSVPPSPGRPVALALRDRLEDAGVVDDNDTSDQQEVDDLEIHDNQVFMDELHEELAELRVRLEEHCQKRSLRFFEGGQVEGPPPKTRDALEVENAWLRSELIFERLNRTSVLMRLRSEAVVDTSLTTKPSFVSGQGVSGAGSGVSTTDPETDTDPDETAVGVAAAAAAAVGVVPGPLLMAHGEEPASTENVVARLTQLLGAARVEISVREQAEESLRRKLHELEVRLREKSTEQKRPVVVDEQAADVQKALVDAHAALDEREAQLRDLRMAVRDQREYEVELQRLQRELIEWEERDITMQSERAAGVDASARLGALREENRSLEDALTEVQLHYESALAEVAALTAASNTATSDALRAERDIDDLKRTMSKMADAYQERLTALEDKFANLQELHVGLLSEMQRKQLVK